MKRVGPELKMPEMKVPPFLSDLFYDFRKRGLLPIVALIVVAIAAVPFVLGGGSEVEEEAAPAPAPTASASTQSSGTSQFVVVKAKPGLREYRKRLDHRSPTDPFKQRYTAPQVKSAELSSPTESSPTFTTETESAPSGSTPAPGQPAGEGSAPGPGKVVYFTWAMQVKIVKTSGSGKKKETEQPQTKSGVVPPATLPAEKAQVVTYIGVNPETQKPLLLVSTDVRSAFGEWKCVAGTDTCQLLEADLNMPETFAYGENDVRYKLTVLSVKKVSIPTPPTSSP